MKPIFHRRYLADYAVLGYVLAYFAWLFTRTPGTPLTLRLGDYAFYPAGLVVGAAFLRNATLARLDGRTRLAWGTLGVASLMLWFSGTTWPSLVQHLGPRAFPAWIDQFEVLQHILVLVALILLPGRRLTSTERTRFRLDLALVLIAGFVMAFHFGVQASLRERPVGTLWGDIAQSSLDWVVFAVAAVGILHKRDATSRHACACLLAANTLYLMANYVFANSRNYQLGDSVDGLWFAAWAFRWGSARLAWHRYHRPEWSPAGETAKGRLRLQNALFSYLMVVLAFGLLISQIVAGDRQFLLLLTLSAGLMVALLVMRQYTELNENQRLFDSHLQQEKRFRSLVQHSSDVVVIIDPAGFVSYVSPAADELFGRGGVAVGGRIESMIEPEAANRLASLLGGERASGGRLQSRVKTTTGAWVEVDVVWSDLRSDPTLGGVVLNCRDVTDRNELERQLRHAQKLDAVGHMAGGLAHDFNNILTAIRGYTELLALDLPPQCAASEDLRQIEQAVDRASAVTRQLLSISRKQTVQPVVLDVNGVLRDLVPLLQQLLTTRIEIALEAEPALWRVQADRGQVEQVIVNLATNARDAMPDGGALCIRTANQCLELAPPELPNAGGGDYVALIVADEGVGMSEEVRRRIFEPFFSTKAADRGMGLGLAMVRRIVNQWGGHIAVATEPGRGTTFTILLPRAVEGVVDRAAEGASVAAAADSRTVLVVDDELGVRTVTRRMLERAGYLVIEASGGDEALLVAGDPSRRIDLLLTDMVMPGMHGRDLVATFRQVRPTVPAVCMTGFAGRGQQPERAADGISVVLSKPFSSELLLRTVAEACASATA